MAFSRAVELPWLESDPSSLPLLRMTVGAIAAGHLDDALWHY